MKANPSGPEGLALQGASAALRDLAVESTTAGAARLASAPLQSQRGSRGILRQAPTVALAALHSQPRIVLPALGRMRRRPGRRNQQVHRASPGHPVQHRVAA